MFLAVIRRACRVLRDRHKHFVRDRRDLQRSRIRRRNDIFLRRVNLADRTFRKRCRICSDIRSLRANCDRAEISAFRRTGKAGNALLRSIISLRLAVRRQLDVLIIVEIDYVIGRVSLNLDRLRLIRYRRVARNLDGGFRHRTIERLFVNGLGSRNLSGRPVPVVVHLIAQIVLLLIIDLNNVLAFIRLNRQRAVVPFKLITILRLLRVRADLRSAQSASAGYGCMFVFYAVVVIFNRIPIRAAIIDIERVINLSQFERLLRISENLVTAVKRAWRCMFDQSARLASSRFHVIL